MQPLLFSYPAIATAGGYAWNTNTKVMPCQAMYAIDGTQAIGTHGYGQSEKAPVVDGWTGMWGETDLAAILNTHVFHDKFGYVRALLSCFILMITGDSA